jgi:hypothetical protein
VPGPFDRLYVVTAEGGAYASGAVYALYPPASPGEPWTESTLYDFSNSGIPFGPIAGGVLYAGTSSELLQLTPPADRGGTWAATVLYSFPGSLAEGGPSSMIMGPDGGFYGTIGYGVLGPVRRVPSLN